MALRTIGTNANNSLTGFVVGGGFAALGALVIAGLIALLIALLTVSFQTIRAAMANPVKSLKTD